MVETLIRPGTLDDLDALVALEEATFETDRMSRRSFRRMVTKANAVLLVHCTAGSLDGYALVLFHAGSPLARLYSLAVDPTTRGRGIGRALLDAVERAALDRECIEMRLELRRDNIAAARLYAAHGYRQFEVQADYYEDHMDAIRLEKSLVPPLPQQMARVPFYEQTLDFTCGPASLLMAMNALDPTLVPTRQLELRVWREATTIYMTSGHGGCGPYGLALSAHHRGFDAEVWVNGNETELFVDSVRSEEKKTVIRLVQQDLIAEMAACGIPLHNEPMSLEAMQAAFEAGAIPVVLISSWRIYGQRATHWVVVTGFDERFVYLHDPYVDDDENKTRLDCVNMPVLKKEFSGMSRFGRNAQRAVVTVWPRRGRKEH